MNCIKQFFTALILVSPALMHGMETKKNHQDQKLAVIELVDLKLQQEVKARGEVKAVAQACAETAQESQVSAQVIGNKKTNQKNFVKTVVYFLRLPHDLQQKIHDFDKKISLSGNLLGHTDSVDCMSTYNDNGVWKAVSVSRDGKLRVWDLTTNKLLHTHDNHYRDLRCVVTYKDGGGWKALFSTADDTLIIFDLVYYIRAAILQGKTQWQGCISIHQAADGPQAITSFSGKICIWDLNTRKLLETFHVQGVSRIATYADSAGLKLVYAIDSTLYVWDVNTRTLLHTLTGHTKDIRHIAVYNDSGCWKAITASNDHTLRTWDLVSGQLLYIFKGHKNGVVYVTVFYDGSGWKAASASYDTTVRIWDLSQAKSNYVLSGHRTDVLCASLYGDIDGLKVLSASYDGAVGLWGYMPGDFERIQESSKKKSGCAIS